MDTTTGTGYDTRLLPERGGGGLRNIAAAAVYRSTEYLVHSSRTGVTALGYRYVFVQCGMQSWRDYERIIGYTYCCCSAAAHANAAPVLQYLRPRTAYFVRVPGEC